MRDVTAAFSKMTRFGVGEVVWGKNAFRKNVYWPARVCDAETEAPAALRRLVDPGRVCLMFYGPSSRMNLDRDWFCRNEKDVLPWDENFFEMQRQDLGRKDYTCFKAAIAEAQMMKQGTTHGLAAQQTMGWTDVKQFVGDAMTSFQMTKKTCSVCHRECEGDAAVYVLCNKCQHPVHEHCDLLTRIPLQARRMLRLCVYYCPRCRQILNSDEQSQFASDYECELHSIRPSATISQGVAIKKETGTAETSTEVSAFEILDREFRKALAEFTHSSEGRTKKEQFDALMLTHRTAAGLPDLKRFTLSLQNARPPLCFPQTQSLEKPVPKIRLQGLPPSLLHPVLATPGASSTERPMQQADVQKEIPVECNGVPGLFYFGQQKVQCECEECLAKPESNRVFTATHFEQHCGAGTAKKWKASVRIRPGGIPEVAPSDPPMPLGRWFIIKGIDELVTRVPVSSRSKKDGNKSTKRQATYTDSGFEGLGRAHQSDFNPWDQVRVGGYMKIHVKYAGDRCSVCDADVDYDYDQLISCDKCGITVHQTCYGVHEKISNDRVWLCNVCRAQGTENAECCLCPIVEGPRKPTTIPGLWAHVACMQWIPEVTVENPMKMEPVSRVNRIQKERWELNCCFCKQKMGAKIQCTACYTAYHPLCARIAGMHMEMKDGPQGSAGPLDLITYCPRHAPPHPELSGIKIVFDQHDGSHRVLFNRQPYPEPLAVSVPLPKAGSARAQPLMEWERKSHGSGSGYGSIAAFWIPLKPVLDDYGNFINADGTPVDPNILPRFRKKRTKTRTASRKHKAARLMDEHMMQPVALLPLPDGIAEKVAVECNGTRGEFVVRCQRVIYDDVLMAAAKFETICGRGDAKKWKSSLWVVDEETDIADLQMHGWLIKVGLDRKTLTALRENYSEYEAYESHLEAQVTKILNELVTSVCNQEGDAEDALKDGEAVDAMEVDQAPTQEIHETDPAAHDGREATQLTDQISCSGGSSAKDVSESLDPLDGQSLATAEFQTQNDSDSQKEDIQMQAQTALDTEPKQGSIVYGAGLIGQAVALWTENDPCTNGHISRYRASDEAHCITDKDGNEAWIRLKEMNLSWNEDRSLLTIHKAKPGDQPAANPSPELPAEIPVSCNKFPASFLVKERMIVSEQGLRMTPREFERACGKGAAKKWKNSIKVKHAYGTGSMSLGEWLIRNGCDPPHPNSDMKRAGIAGYMPGAYPYRSGDAAWAPKQRRQRHPLGCQCAVCHQSQKRASQCNLTGRMEGDDGNRCEKWQPATTLASLRARGPGIRSGKRAYIRAVPQIVGGITRHEPHEIPRSKCWNVQDWLKHVQGQKSDAGSDAPPERIMCKTEKWRIQLKRCNETQDERVTFGKSGVHGWGLFALQDHKQDEMIIEYRGEIVTPAVADMREQRYRAMETDCYLFHVNDSFIIDATLKGSISRFINHCCEPCMYCKDIQLDGKNHLCFFARYDIQAGQELTYDYRFKEEVEENKLPCDCGAPNCRGFLN